MASVLRMFPLVMVVVISTELTSAQQSKEVTITEPGIYELAGLFKQADTVALVKVVSGDTEAYDIAVYKAEVVKKLQRCGNGRDPLLRPYVGERLGWEYILFLRNVPKPISPKTTSSTSYGTIHYAEIFNEGYSSMMTSYECVFDGKDTAQKCDYGVRACTDYIVLPKSTPTFPPVTEDTPFGCRWVRKAVFIPLLEKLGNARK